jgi:nitroreductase
MEAMSATEAIYRRRSVRSYTGEPLDDETVHSLLSAAVQAPTAVHTEPWAFVVVQDQALLQRLSHDAKAMMADELDACPRISEKRWARSWPGRTSTSFTTREP